MFQTFSGTSRRPRQVNLSGQNVNPFNATSWAPTASGTKKTVAAAQQERLQRQLERERLNATKRIQRSWRGHYARKQLANGRREMWDNIEQSQDGSCTSADLAVSFRLLVAFFNDQNPDDIKRLDRLCQRILLASPGQILSGDDFRPHISRLLRVLLASLSHPRDTFPKDLLRLVVLVVESHPYVVTNLAPEYYKVISTILCYARVKNETDNLLLLTIGSPLVEHTGMGDRASAMLEVYSAFALNFLTTPDLPEKFGSMVELSKRVNIGLLSQALIRQQSTSALLALPSEPRLWLMAHFICIHRLQQGIREEPNFLRALSTLLSNCANDIVGRIDSGPLRESVDEDDERTLPTLPLPSFVREELVSLVNKESITGLLAKFNLEYNATQTSKAEGDASLLASYALILLRIFPTLGEEIRMWLYQGSITVAGTGRQIPALKLFWKAMNETRTFVAITNDSTAALTILRAGSRRQNSPKSLQDEIFDRDWRAILLFLELYAFVLRFTDDEEFLNGETSGIIDQNQPTTRSRESALPLEDVKLLTMFLKNLSFTMYYNVADLTSDNHAPASGSLGSYFGTAPSRQVSTVNSRIADQGLKSAIEAPKFLGITGMTYDYVRSIVTRVMRMLYERDSRRRFLPKDHWLMTSRFDMEGFIPAVVAEEERRNQVAEEGDDDHDTYDSLAESGADIIGMQRPRRLRYLENLQRQQQKLAKKNILAAVGPRLEILQNMPYVIPFKTRVQIFRQFVYQDQLRRRDGTVDPDQWRMSLMHSHGGHPSNVMREILGRHHAKIRRDHIFEDAYEQFFQLGEGLKEPIQITFVDKFDTVEAGIDGGGVTKEFLTSVTNEAFRSAEGPNLFVANDQNLLYPNPAALDERRELLRQSGIKESDPEWRENINDLLRQYEFLGRIVGKCLYEGILVDIGFAGFFLLKWASTDNTGSSSQESRYLANINDLRDLDESLYQGLLQLKNYPGNVEDFSLDFTVTDTVSLPGEPTRTITRELLPNGANIPVTNENRVLYVSGVARHRLHGQPFQQTRAFLRGLGQMIKPSWLSMFNQAELQTLIGGDSSQIDVEDLRRNTIYSGVYEIGDDGLEHPTVQLFWEVMKELDDSDRRKVLKYVTSTPRAPLLGFGQLNPRFSIRDAGADEQRLPSTSTCINLLKLPRYGSKAILESKLLYAVNSGAGFDLS